MNSFYFISRQPLIEDIIIIHYKTFMIALDTTLFNKMVFLQHLLVIRSFYFSLFIVVEKRIHTAEKVE